jgi:hypothetical protein
VHDLDERAQRRLDRILGLVPAKLDAVRVNVVFVDEKRLVLRQLGAAVNKRITKRNKPFASRLDLQTTHISTSTSISNASEGRGLAGVVTS